MSFSFLKSLGLGASNNPVMLVVHNTFIMAAQVSIENGSPKLIGFNQVEIESGIIREGKIYDPAVFQELVTKLFKEAQPNAIKTKTALVNIPFELTYPFLKNYSSKTTKEIAKDSMYDYVEKNSPILLKDLSIHEKTYSNAHFTYGVIGVPKAWEDRMSKILKNVGIKECEFIPEPYLRTSLIKKDLADNFTLFSFHENRVYVSLFHNKVLYDSYFLKFQMSEDGQLNCPSCFQEFLLSKENVSVNGRDENGLTGFMNVTIGKQKEVMKCYFEHPELVSVYDYAIMHYCALTDTFSFESKN
jgi:hypothetical protein